jgi:signal transduction histidine kinase
MMTLNDRREALQRMGWAIGALSVGALGEILGGAPIGPVSLEIHLAWAALFLVLAGLAASGRVPANVLGTFELASSLLLFPALLFTTGCSDSPFYVVLPIMPLMLAVLHPKRSSLIAVVGATAAFWTLFLSVADGSPSREIIFDLLAVACTTGVGIFGARRLTAALEAERKAAEELVESMQRVAASEKAERLAASLATMGQIAAGVAHEVNNPLAYVESNIRFINQGLAEASPDLGEIRDAARESEEGLKRIRQLVADMKGISRQGEDKSPIDLGAVLQTSARMAAANVKPRAKLVVEVESSLPLNGNAARLGQVFLNLLINAAQAIPEGNPGKNEVRLTARTTEGFAHVEVTDTGSGISPEVQAKLFRPFFTTKPVGVGTGLGLSICQRIIQEAGGSISVSSEVGRGSTFSVNLPLSAA